MAQRPAGQFVTTEAYWMVAKGPKTKDVALLAPGVYRDVLTVSPNEKIPYVIVFTDWDQAENFAKQRQSAGEECHEFTFDAPPQFVDLLTRLQDAGEQHVGFDPVFRSGKTTVRLLDIETVIKRWRGKR